MAREKPQLEGVYSKGYGLISHLVMADTSIDYGAKALYSYLCSCTGADNTCYPSREKICHDLGMNKDTFTKYKTQLVKSGYISVEKVCQNGRPPHNLYRITSDLPCPKISDNGCPKISDTINNNTINNNIINNTPYNPPTGDYSPQGEPSPKGKGKKKAEFIPPTLGEVIAYCASRGNKVDPKKFYDYYDASGWVDGKGNPVRNWKQKCITWERSDDRAAPSGSDGRIPQASDAQAPSPAMSEAELDELFGFSLDKT